jgi:hypothetical protein
MINKTLYFLDKYIDLNIIRKFLNFFRYVYFKIKSLIEVPFIDKKKGFPDLFYFVFK